VLSAQTLHEELGVGVRVHQLPPRPLGGAPAQPSGPNPDRSGAAPSTRSFSLQRHPLPSAVLGNSSRCSARDRPRVARRTESASRNSCTVSASVTGSITSTGACVGVPPGGKSPGALLALVSSIERMYARSYVRSGWQRRRSFLGLDPTNTTPIPKGTTWTSR
jgi:hypothetical protein